MKYKLSIFKIVIYMLILFAIAIIYELIIDKCSSILPGFFYLDTKIITIENLMYYMWQVQVTMALISISLTSLIIGKLDYKIYGLDFKSILMISSRFELNYIEKIMYIIILSIANLWFILYGKLPCLMIFFIMDMISIIQIIIDSYIILFNSGKYKDKIRNYLYDKINDITEKSGIKDVTMILSTIDVHNRELITNNDIEGLNDNVDYLIDAVKNIKEKCNKENAEELNNLIESSIIYLLELMCKNGHLSLALKQVDKIIDKEFDYVNKENLVIQIIKNLLSLMENLKTERDYRDLSAYILYRLIYELNIDKHNIREVSYLQIDCISNVYRNTQLNEYLKENIFRYQLSLVIPSRLHDSSNINLIKKKTINHLVKMLILNLDEKYFEKFFSDFYRDNLLGLHLTHCPYAFEIIIVINIFVYYVTMAEELYSRKFKNSVRKFTEIKAEKDNISSDSVNSLMIKLGTVVWEYYDNVIKEMDETGFEYIPNTQVKALILTNTIEKYYIFYSIAFLGEYNYQEIINRFFDIILSQKTLQYFNNEGHFKKNIESEFNSFLKFYKLKYDEKIVEKLRQFHFILSRKYAKHILLKQQEYSNNEKVITKCEEIKEKVYSRLRQNPCYEIVEYTQESEKDIHIATEIELDKSVLSGDIIMIGISYEDLIIDTIESELIKAIIEQAYIHTYKYDDSNKITRLLEFIKSKKIEVNTLINGKLTDDWWFTNDENEENIEKLRKLEECDYNYKLGNMAARNTILSNLGENKFYISIELFEIKEINNEQINNIIKSDLTPKNNYYEIEILNSIKVLFSTEEVKEYLKLKNMIVNLKFIIKEIENKKTKYIALQKEY